MSINFWEDLPDGFGDEITPFIKKYSGYNPDYESELTPIFIEMVQDLDLNDNLPIPENIYVNYLFRGLVVAGANYLKEYGADAFVSHIDPVLDNENFENFYNTVGVEELLQTYSKINNYPEYEFNQLFEGEEDEMVDMREYVTSVYAEGVGEYLKENAYDFMSELEDKELISYEANCLASSIYFHDYGEIYEKDSFIKGLISYLLQNKNFDQYMDKHLENVKNELIKNHDLSKNITEELESPNRNVNKQDFKI